MAANARKAGEAFEDYRERLRGEALIAEVVRGGRWCRQAEGSSRVRRRDEWLLDGVPAKKTDGAA